MLYERMIAMKYSFKKICTSAIVLAVTVFTVTALAADDTSTYGFRKGKANHYGTGGEQTFVYSDSHHADTETLIESGIIDQATADKISEYMSEKHREISAIYDNMANMSAEERHKAFAEKSTSRKDGLEGLVEAGIITEEQSELIKNHTENQ